MSPQGMIAVTIMILWIIAVKVFRNGLLGLCLTLPTAMFFPVHTGPSSFDLVTEPLQVILNAYILGFAFVWLYRKRRTGV